MIIKSSAHIHSQIREEIINTIEKGEFKPLDQLPSEEELATRFSVSRSSIRNALLSLEQDGLVIRRHGIGTFIAPYPIKLQNRVDHLVAIPDQISNLGYVPKLGFSESKIIKGPSAGHKKLDLKNEIGITHSKRLYLAGDIPAVFIDDYLLISFIEKDPVWLSFSGNMVQYMESEFDLKIEYAYTRLWSESASEKIAKILDVEIGCPLIIADRVSYDSNGIPIACGISYNNSKIIQLDFVQRRR